MIGLPGSGKSTVGRHLARLLSLRLLDLDAEIERRIGTTVSACFDRCGEAGFRVIEAEALEAATQGEGTVIATGGGAVLCAGNRQMLRQRTTVVYLRSRPEDIARRLRNDTKRPLLQVADPLRRLREMHAVRDPLYRETAHYVVDIGRPSLPTVLNTILMQLELAGIVDAGAVPSPVDAWSQSQR